MYILITEPNHVHYNRRGLVTMSEYGFLTVTLLPVNPTKVKTFLHIRNVTTLGEFFLGRLKMAMTVWKITKNMYVQT